MGKKLAIKGHPTRGKEVIELLEMMGGSNIHNLSGCNDYAYYVNDGHQNIIRGSEYIFGNEDMQCFTLEEFLEKFPFKVGDKVIDDYVFGDPLTIKSMSWLGELKTMLYSFEESDVVLAAKDLKAVNVADDDHTEPSKMKNVLAELLEHIKTTPKEELEKEFKEIEEWSNVGPTVEEFMTFCECVNKKPKYPATYEECEKILGLEDSIIKGCLGYEYKLLNAFQKLLMCRDAYWEIAGEQMGLDRYWKPDWKDETQVKYMITTFNNELEFFSSIHSYVVGRRNHTLSFPTEEIRDAFFENFKDLIEQCKELL